MDMLTQQHCICRYVLASAICFVFIVDWRARFVSAVARVQCAYRCLCAFQDDFGEICLSISRKRGSVFNL
jgi:hypothetical protein